MEKDVDNLPNLASSAWIKRRMRANVLLLLVNAGMVPLNTSNFLHARHALGLGSVIPWVNALAGSFAIVVTIALLRNLRVWRKLLKAALKFEGWLAQLSEPDQKYVKDMMSASRLQVCKEDRDVQELERLHRL